MESPHTDDIPPAIAKIESDWLLWLATLFPEVCYSPFAQHQAEFWQHVWSIKYGVRPRPYVAVWNRGAGKSSAAELAAISLGSRRLRRYLLYISGTQQQADEHVGSISSLLESEAFGLFYPELADREVGKFGNVKGWRRNRLRTIGGFAIDALGLDTSFRGIRIDNIRPDGVVLDDVDADDDSPQETERKIRVITRKILPALAPHAAIIAIQNLITPEGVFSRLANKATERADFLVDRIVSGPIPAVRDMEVAHKNGRWEITSGTATWEGMPLEACQEQIDTFGISAFLIECQHATETRSGGMYDHIEWQRCAYDDLPHLDRVSCWVDPAVTSRDTSDSHAIQVDGISRDRKLYRLWSWEQRATPTESLKLALSKALEYGADSVGIETDQGGDTWKSVFREAKAELRTELIAEAELFDHDSANYVETMEQVATLDALRMRSAKAGQGHGAKAHRSAKMLTAYEQGRVVHVEGTHDVLERALHRFPRYKPLDLCLAAGTPVLTADGHVPIESVLPGDLVMTRQGWRRVLHSDLTGVQVPTVQIEGQDWLLRGTPTHPVWVEDAGWQALCTIRRGDRILAWNTAPSKAASENSPLRDSAYPTTRDGGDMATRSAEPSASTSFPAPSKDARTDVTPRVYANRTRSVSIDMATRSAEDHPDREMSSGKKSSSTGSSSIGIPTPPDVPTASTSCAGPVNTSTVLFGSPSTDRSPKVAASTTAMATRSTTIPRTSNSSSPAPTTCATITVPTIGLRSDVSGTENFWNVSGLSLPHGTAARKGEHGIVSMDGGVTPSVVLAMHDAGPADVYNLTVEDVPEFIAGGILVHNCDAAYWSFFDLMGHTKAVSSPPRRAAGGGGNSPRRNVRSLTARRIVRSA